MTTVDHAIAGNLSATTPLLSVKQAAGYLSVSESTIRRLVAGDKLVARRVGAQLRFDRAELDRLSVEGGVRKSAPTGLPSDAMKVPAWAEERLGVWRQGLARLLPDPQRTQVVVIDRRGAKAFSMLRPLGYQWGANLWHSTALSVQSDEQVLQLFEGAEVVVFDEMVQRGRDLAAVRTRLERLGLGVRSVCLVRRRSIFLDGWLADLNVEPIEDLVEPDWDDATTFLSRLFDYCEPPLDPEHVLIVGNVEGPLNAVEAQERVGHYGVAGLVWNRQSGDDSSVAALTIDRPQFFDVGSLLLPDGITARWDGPCKVRLYISDRGRLVTLTFITFPSLEGSTAAWQALVQRTYASYGWRESAPTDGNGLRDEDVERAYNHVCTELSIELLRQTVAAGLLDSLGLQNSKGPQADELAAFFGRRRGKEMHQQIRSALAQYSKQSLALAVGQAVPLVVDRERPFAEAVDPEAGQEAVINVLARAGQTDASSLAGHVRMTYRDLLHATRPVEETAISAALDGLLDGVRAKPVDIVIAKDGRYEVARAFATSEYGPDDPYDQQDVRRTQAVAVSAFEQWLGHRGLADETEIQVAKLFANLVHDWGPQFRRLAMQNYPYKHGMMPRVDTKVPWRSEEPRYFLRELERADLLIGHRAQRSSRYALAQGIRVDELVQQANVNGHERAQIRSLVRAYALIQERCKVARPRTASRSDVATFSDPLVVLSSARNEQIAYECSLFELGDWIAVGRGLFRMLGGHAAKDAGSKPYVGRVSREVATFAQAAAFLFAKIAMYESVPDLRRQMVNLFATEQLDAGEILLESVTAEARLEVDYAATRYPMGPLVWALGIIQPFSSFMRQVLTLFGLEQDRRRPEARVETREDGTVVDRDVRYYAARIAEAVGDEAVAANVARLSEKAITAAGDRTAEAEVLNQVARVFERLVEILGTRVKTADDLEIERARGDERHRDLIAVSRWLDEHSLLGGVGSLVAVGDFYNFVNFVARTAAWVGASSATMAQGLQARIGAVAAELQPLFPTTVARVSTDTCILASDDADELFAAAQHINEAMRLEVESWDRGLVKLCYMRFGMTRVESDFFGAVAKGMKLGDRHGVARGALALSEAAFGQLGPVNAERCVRDHGGDDDAIYLLLDPEETS